MANVPYVLSAYMSVEVHYLDDQADKYSDSDYDGVCVWNYGNEIPIRMRLTREEFEDFLKKVGLQKCEPGELGDEDSPLEVWRAQGVPFLNDLLEQKERKQGGISRQG